MVEFPPIRFHIILIKSLKQTHYSKKRFFFTQPQRINSYERPYTFKLALYSRSTSYHWLVELTGAKISFLDLKCNVQAPATLTFKDTLNPHRVKNKQKLAYSSTYCIENRYIKHLPLAVRCPQLYREFCMVFYRTIHRSAAVLSLTLSTDPCVLLNGAWRPRV